MWICTNASFSSIKAVMMTVRCVISRVSYTLTWYTCFGCRSLWCRSLWCRSLWCRSLWCRSLWCSLLPEPELEPEPVELLSYYLDYLLFHQHHPWCQRQMRHWLQGYCCLLLLDAYTKGITYAVVPNTINADTATIIPSPKCCFIPL